MTSASITKLAVFRHAFFSSLPVLMGYTTMGFAAGVLLAMKSGIRFPAVWAFLTSATSISGTLQFMMAGWVHMQTPLLQVALLTFCLNIRYAMYGLSLIERFRGIPLWQRLYLIWSLTDETYALEVGCRIPAKEQNIRFCLYLAALDHCYWIIGVTAGAIAGTTLPIPNKGIDFTMTALFLVILTDQCREKENRLYALIGGGASLFSLITISVFHGMKIGVDNMLIPSMILMVTVFLIFRKKLDKEQKESVE